MKIIDRIHAYIEFQGMSLNSFDEKIGAGNGYIGKQIKRGASIGSDILETIVRTFPDLNPYWLLTGKDPMILANTPFLGRDYSAEKDDFEQIPPLPQEHSGRDFGRIQAGKGSFSGQNAEFMPRVITVDSDGKENILYVPVKAYAGYLSGYSDPEYLGSLQSFSLPGLRHGTYRMFEVTGPSMAPTVGHEDRVIAEYISSFDDVRDGRVYVLVTHSRGIVLKRVLNRLSERGKIVCKSDTIAHKNEYKTYQLDPEDIKEIWYCRLKFSADFSEPSEIYHRVGELESDIVEIKEILSGLDAVKNTKLKPDKIVKKKDASE